MMINTKCIMCNNKFDNKIELLKHLKISKCAEIYLNIKFNKSVIVLNKNNIYNKIGLKNIVTKYFNENNGYGKNKSVVLKLLKKIITILDEFKIDYMAISGTLLGFIRHNDLIPWDDDIDLLVDDSINDKITDMYIKYKNDIHFIKYGNIIKICLVDGIHPICNQHKFYEASIGEIKRYNYPFIDLFVMKKTENKIHFFDKEWDIEQFYPLTQYLYNDFNINIPKNPIYFLNENYGENWNDILISNYWCHKYEIGYNKIFKIYKKDYEQLK